MTPRYVVRLRGTTPLGAPVTGTGVIVQPDGAILTCWHVVHEIVEVLVDLPYPHDRAARYTQRAQIAPGLDLAVIRPSVPLGRPVVHATAAYDWVKRVKEGDGVAVWGFSSPIFVDPQHIPATIRAFSVADASIGLSGNINFGDSGGAVLTADEKLFGIVYMRDKEKDGIALAIPITLAPGELFIVQAGAVLLPPATEVFVGRQNDIQKALTHFDAGRRLVNIVGLGGIGKSECARAIAREAVARPWCPEGVRYIDLKSATSAAEVIALIRGSLGLSQATTGVQLGGLLAGQVFIILDDVYQALSEDGKAVRQLLRDLVSYSAPARLLITCRSDLGLGPEETKLQLGRLQPPFDRQLFEQLATSYGYAWQQGDGERVVELLAQLDGYPLGLTIAANMLQDLSLERLMDRWKDKGTAALNVPGIERKDLDQLTSVDYSLAVSFDDLGDAERQLFGTFSLLPAGGREALFDQIQNIDSTAILQTLLRRSLVSKSDDRFAMLVPAREFAGRTLSQEARDHAVAAIDRYYATLSADWDTSDAWRSRRLETIAAITPELPNVHAAIDRARQRGDHAVVAVLTSGLREYYIVTPAKESDERLEAGVKSAIEAGDERREAEMRSALGTIYWIRDKYDKSRKAQERALTLFRKLKDRRGEADCLWSLAGILWMDDQYDAARTMNQQALAIYREPGDVGGQAKAIQSIGDCDRMQKLYGEARERYAEALRLFRQIPYDYGEAACLRHLGDVNMEEGKTDDAADQYEQSLRIFQHLGDTMGTAHSTRSIADVTFARNEYEAAAIMYEQAKALYLRLGDGYDAAGTAWRFSECAEKVSDLHCAVAAMKEALQLYREIPIEDSAKEAAERLAALEKQMAGHEAVVSRSAQSGVTERHECRLRWPG